MCRAGFLQARALPVGDPAASPRGGVGLGIPVLGSSLYVSRALGGQTPLQQKLLRSVVEKLVLWWHLLGQLWAGPLQKAPSEKQHDLLFQLSLLLRFPRLCSGWSPTAPVPLTFAARPSFSMWKMGLAVSLAAGFSMTEERGGWAAWPHRNLVPSSSCSIVFCTSSPPWCPPSSSATCPGLSPSLPRQGAAGCFLTFTGIPQSTWPG